MRWEMQRILRIGTRSSPLAMRQTEIVLEKLLQVHPGSHFQVVPVRISREAWAEGVAGDRKESFVRDLRRLLAEGGIDMAVHSLKDVPIMSQPQLCVAAYPAAEDPRDAFVSILYQRLAAVPSGGRIGTSSPRRVMQLALCRPDLRVLPLSGNVDTRLMKLRRGEYDGLILAAAGLKRLGLEGAVKEILPPERFVPSPGQGVIAVEARAADREVIGMLEEIDDPRARMRALAERSFCAEIGADCGTATGVVARAEGQTVEIVAFHSFGERREALLERLTGPLEEAEELGRELARRMLSSARGQGVGGGEEGGDAR